MKTGKITLIGAGPGDPELITLKGIKALSKADVILYDALVHPDILEYAKADASLIFVGKRERLHTYSQDEINELIVQFAFEGKNVARVKGGDPYVFGRGHEELFYAENLGLEVNVIPGISSAVAVPQNVGIPVTRRNVSDGFWVITATKSDGELSDDIYLASLSSSTVVILMGLNKLSKIAEIYTSVDKTDTPVAVIQNGTLENEKSVAGTFANICELVEINNIKTPAVIVIGEVVKYHKEKTGSVISEILEKKVA
jgi:uroporphyrin-III C-methyltransferase